jgi:hypothetical protein
MSPNAGGGVGCGASANEYSCTHVYSCMHGAQINIGDLTPYLIYDLSLSYREFATKTKLKFDLAFAS